VLYSNGLEEARGMLMNGSRAAAVLQREGLDGVIASTLENVGYLTGFFDPNFCQFRGMQEYCVLEAGASEPGWLVLPRFDLDLVAAEPPRARRIVSFGTFFYGPPGTTALSPFEERLARLAGDAPAASPLEALAAVIAETAMRRIGTDERGIFPGVLEGLRRKFPEREFVPASHVFSEIRAVKTADEIARLASAVRIAEEAIYACLRSARPGVTEREMAQEFEVALLRAGARPWFSPSGPIVGFGRGSVGVNRPADLSTLLPGDHIRFDVGCIFEGYWSDIARTFSFGAPSSRLTQVYRAVRTGQDAALRAVAPGVKASEVFEAGLAAARAEGMPHYERQHVGHGIGLEVNEAPILTAKTHQPLEAGMVLDVELAYYEPGFGGVHVEDTLVVTDTGHRPLTRTSRDLVRLA
jgi:Xaa-Pro dipeptidase